MADHKAMPVPGYADQPQNNVDRVSTNKLTEERILRDLDVAVSYGADPRWVAIAKTHMEQAFMAWNRAIFKPTRVKLPEDTENE